MLGLKERADIELLGDEGEEKHNSRTGAARLHCLIFIIIPFHNDNQPNGKSFFEKPISD